MDSNCRETDQRYKTVYANPAFLGTMVEIVCRFNSLVYPYRTRSETESREILTNITDDHEYITNFWCLKDNLGLAIRSISWVLRLVHLTWGRNAQSRPQTHLIRIEGYAALFLANDIDGKSLTSYRPPY